MTQPKLTIHKNDGSKGAFDNFKKALAGAQTDEYLLEKFKKAKGAYVVSGRFAPEGKINLEAGLKFGRWTKDKYWGPKQDYNKDYLIIINQLDSSSNLRNSLIIRPSTCGEICFVKDDILDSNIAPDVSIISGGKGDKLLFKSNYRYHSIKKYFGKPGVSRIGVKKGSYFVTKWDSKGQNSEIKIFTLKNDNYYGGGDYWLKGISNKRKLFVTSKFSGKNQELKIHTINYCVNGQKIISTRKSYLPEGTKEIPLPANCELVSLIRPDGVPVVGAYKKLIADKSKNGDIRNLFVKK